MGGNSCVLGIKSMLRRRVSLKAAFDDRLAARSLVRSDFDVSAFENREHETDLKRINMTKT